MCGKPVWSGFRTLPHSDMICRAYFWPPASRFSRFWRPAGKQVFPVTPTAASPDRREAEPFVFHMIEAVGFFLYPLMRTSRAFH
jgi:hypothetical protein